MRELIKASLFVFPWMLLVGILIWWLFVENPTDSERIRNYETTTVVQGIESLGKLELVKYNFKEITELTEMSEEFLNFFKLGPDSKIALISTGEAVGCLDLTKLNEDNVQLGPDTLVVHLPEPELCYFKLDMSRSKIYALQTNPLKDERAFIERAYKNAEQDIKQAAFDSGIIEQTKSNAVLILRPMLENMTGKKVVLIFGEPDRILEDQEIPLQ